MAKISRKKEEQGEWEKENCNVCDKEARCFSVP
jgi:hypothetical protein